MFESDEGNLEGGCEDGEKETRDSTNTRGQNGEPILKRCCVCRERFQIPDAAYTAALRTLCIKCRIEFKHTEPRSAYSVQVHIGDPHKYYVQRLKTLDYREKEWITVKLYLSLADAMRYIYDRTGER